MAKVLSSIRRSVDPVPLPEPGSDAAFAPVEAKAAGTRSGPMPDVAKVSLTGEGEKAVRCRMDRGLSTRIDGPIRESYSPLRARNAFAMRDAVIAATIGKRNSASHEKSQWSD
jgi:hypothetical protein